MDQKIIYYKKYKSKRGFKKPTAFATLIIFIIRSLTRPSAQSISHRPIQLSVMYHCH